jgi:hypothetical protein
MKYTLLYIAFLFCPLVLRGQEPLLNFAQQLKRPLDSVGFTGGAQISGMVGDFIIQTNGAERLRVFNDGRVSIGGTTRYSKANVFGGLFADSLILNTAASITGGVGIWNFNAVSSVPTIRLNAQSGVLYAKLAFNTDGAINDNRYIQHYGSTMQFNVPTGERYEFAVNNLERVRITNTGIGINNQNPQDKLEIAGGTGKSGLRFTDLTSSISAGASTAYLAVNANGEVVRGAAITSSGNTTSTNGTVNTLSMFNGANSIINSPLSLSGTVIVNSGTFRTIPGGSASVPAYALNTNSGLFWTGTRPSISVNGTERLGINSMGHLYLNSGNIYVGQSGNTNADPYQNVGVGVGVMAAITGYSNANAGFGYYSLGTLQNGNGNLAFGAYSQYENVSNSNNASLGSYTLQYAKSSNNTAMGGNSASGVTTGGNNTSVGYGSGNGNNTGSENTYLGYNAGYNTGTINNVSNTIYIGSNMPNNGVSNGMYIGNGTNNLFSWKNAIYNWDLSSSGLTTGQEGFTWQYNSLNNKIQLLAPVNIFTSNGTITSDRFIYGNYNLYLGVPVSGAKFGVNNPNFITALNIESVRAGLKVDNGGTGNNIVSGLSTSFRTFWAGTEYVKIDSTTGITLASGKKLTGLPTTLATGSDAISVTQSDNTYVKYFASGTVNVANKLFAPQDFQSATVTVTGAAIGDVVHCTGYNMNTAFVVSGKVLIAGQIDFTIYNFTTSTINMAGGQIAYKVFR